MLKLDQYEDWEGQFVQVSGGRLSNKLVLGNLYRPPKDLNEKYRQFTNELSPILSRLETLNLGYVMFTRDRTCCLGWQSC